MSDERPIGVAAINLAYLMVLKERDQLWAALDRMAEVATRAPCDNVTKSKCNHCLALAEYDALKLASNTDSKKED